jgi:hypothetical protein
MKRIMINTFFLLLLGLFCAGCQNQNTSVNTDKTGPDFIGLDDEMLLNVGMGNERFLICHC